MISSRSLKPDGVPVSEVPSIDSRWSLSSSSCSTSSIALKSCWRSSRATSSIAFSACSTSSRGGAWCPARSPGSRRCSQQPPQQRVLAHDLRVAAGVPGGRHDAGQLVHGRRAADLLELAHLAQAVGHRQHVDRLALVVEREHRLVDRAVALAIEVLGAQALLDHERVQRAVREQDRAEHGLLGVEVVGRRDRARGRPRRAVGCRDGAHRSGEFRVAAMPARRPFPQIAGGKAVVASTNGCSHAARRPGPAARVAISWRRPWS